MFGVPQDPQVIAATVALGARGYLRWDAARPHMVATLAHALTALMGVIHGCRIVDAQMAEAGRGGHIVNVASGLAFVPTAYPWLGRRSPPGAQHCGGYR
jgi:NAD(P)-dependent dehydrogenase (short-subunit alcohol dehydrogenase family)